MTNEEKTIRLTFLGDLMCTIPMTQKAERKNSYDYTPVFEYVKKHLQRSDYVVGNLETPLAGADCLYTFHPTEFNTPDEFAKALLDAGIDMVTTANNHSLDRGVYGLKRTLAVLDTLGIEHAGTQSNTETRKTLYKAFDGLNFAFISYTYDTNSLWMNNKLREEDTYCINLFREQESYPVGGECPNGSVIRSILRKLVPEFIKDSIRDKSKEDCGILADVGATRNKRFEDKLYEDIRDAKKNADYVFVCMHIGGQYNDKIGQYTDRIISNCNKAGADFLICNHPHCVLPLSLDERGKLTAYALGNFCYTPHWGYYVEGKYAEYSIMVHVIFSEASKLMVDIRFSILKSVNNPVNTQVYNIYDLYKMTNNKSVQRSLEKDVANVLKRMFPGRKFSMKIKDEYSIQDF